MIKVIMLPIEKNKEYIQLTEVLNLHNIEENLSEIKGELSLNFLSEMGLDQIEED